MRYHELKESAFGYWQDNPALRTGEEGEHGKEWLQRHQEDAEHYAKGRLRGAAACMLIGASTAAMGQRRPMYFPSKLLKLIPGANNEDRKPGEGQFDSLLKRIEAEGFDMDPRHAVLVGVNHKGDAFIIEGNTRTAVAVYLKIPYIPAEFRWFNGGELADGIWTPKIVGELGQSEPVPK